MVVSTAPVMSPVSQLWVEPIMCNCVQTLNTALSHLYPTIRPPSKSSFPARFVAQEMFLVFKFLLHILKNSHSYVGFTFSNRLQQPQLQTENMQENIL